MSKAIINYETKTELGSRAGRWVRMGKLGKRQNINKDLILG